MCIASEQYAQCLPCFVGAQIFDDVIQLRKDYIIDTGTRMKLAQCQLYNPEKFGLIYHSIPQRSTKRMYIYGTYCVVT